MTAAGDAPAIRLAPASNIASTFSLTIRRASLSAARSPTASFASRRPITSQDSKASMAPANHGKPSSASANTSIIAAPAFELDIALYTLQLSKTVAKMSRASSFRIRSYGPPAGKLQHGRLVGAESALVTLDFKA